MVANSTATTIGVSTPTSFLTTTLSTKYFVEAGSTSPDKRLMAMSTKPIASNPRLVFINAQTSGRFFQVFLRFSVFDGDLGSFSAAMICGMKVPCALDARNLRISTREILRKQRRCSVSGGSRARYARPGRSVEIEHAGDEFAQRDAQVAPQAPLQAGIILGAAEEVAHQLAEDRAAAQELHHARRDRASQKRPAIKPAHDARRKFEFRGERSLHPRGIFFRAPGGQGPAEQFAGADRVKESFAGQGIHPGGRITYQGPIFSGHGALGKGALQGSRQHMTVKLCAFGRDILPLHKLLQMAAEFRARVRGHAAANSHGQVIAAREGPDVALEVGKKFYGDGVGRLRNKIALRHFQLVALQG